MFSRAVDLLFIDSFAFAINATLGAMVQTKLCNYSWEGETNRPIEEMSSQKPSDDNQRHE